MHLFLYRQGVEGLQLHFCYWIKEFDFALFLMSQSSTNATKAAVPLQCACSRSDWTSAGATQPDDKEVRCVLSFRAEWVDQISQSVHEDLHILVAVLNALWILLLLARFSLIPMQDRPGGTGWLSAHGHGLLTTNAAEYM